MFDAPPPHFTPRQSVEPTLAIAWENYRARFNRAFAVERVEQGGGDFLDRDTVMGLFGAWCDRNRVRADELRVVKAERARMVAAAGTRRRAPDAAAGTDDRRHGWAGVRWWSGERPGSSTGCRRGDSEWLLVAVFVSVRPGGPAAPGPARSPSFPRFRGPYNGLDRFGGVCTAGAGPGLQNQWGV